MNVCNAPRTPAINGSPTGCVTRTDYNAEAEAQTHVVSSQPPPKALVKTYLPLFLHDRIEHGKVKY